MTPGMTPQSSVDPPEAPSRWTQLLNQAKVDLQVAFAPGAAGGSLQSLVPRPDSERDDNNATGMRAIKCYRQC